MKISTNITRKDLIIMHLGTFISWSSLIWIVALYAFITYPLLFDKNKVFCVTQDSLLYGLKTTFFLYFGFGAFFAIISIFFSNEVLGNHIYTISPDHFTSESDINTTTTKWPGIKKIRKTKFSIYINTTWYLMHIIPISAFNSKNDFDSFYEKLTEYRSSFSMRNNPKDKT